MRSKTGVSTERTAHNHCRKERLALVKSCLTKAKQAYAGLFFGQAAVMYR
ncbi:MAG: hypothetical protein ABF839_02090 [Acetobacter orientalis]|nr:hypothetical protein [Acetobacter orientalis]